jgi:NTE family protein
MRRMLILCLLATLATGCTRMVRDSCKLGPPGPLPDLGPCLPEGPEPFPFTNLAVEGGGVKGIAYAGALEALEKAGVRPQIKEIAGTSAGAFTALLITLGYDAQELQKILLGTKLTDFEDDGDDGPFRLVEDFGWYSGDFILSWLRCRVKDRTGNPGTTFKDLHEARNADGTPRYPNLTIITTHLNRHASVELSHRTVPCMPVALAARMSSSIPLFWNAVQLDLGQFQGPDCSKPRQSRGKDVFVDGGVLWNYPIDFFEVRDGAPAPFPETLGLYLSPPSGKEKERARISDLPEYLKSLFSTVLDVQVQAFNRNACDQARSVQIDSMGVGTTDFNLTREQQIALVRSGYTATCNYLKQWNRQKVEEACGGATPTDHPMLDLSTGAVERR